MARIALSIAGSDPSGGAGIQADLKVFHSHGVYGEAVISLLTAQNSLGVQAVWPVEPAQIAAQIDALWDDMPPDALKTGALPSPEAVAEIARSVAGRGRPLVVDPILRPTTGAAFSHADLVDAMRRHLLPIAALVTPNLDEACALSGLEVCDVSSALAAAHALCRLGAQAALVKGGHMSGDPIDVLCLASGKEHVFRDPRIETPHTHGTGCALSAAITARLALGAELVDAVTGARKWLRRALSSPLGLGRGRGPLNHFVPGAVEG